MHHGAAFAHRQVVDDFVLAGFDVQFDLDKADGEAWDRAALGQGVLGDADQAGAGDARHCPLGDLVNVLGHFDATVLAAHLDGFGRRLAVGQGAGGAAAAKHPLAVDVVVFGLAAECRCGDFLELGHGVQGGDVIGPGVREDGDAAGLVAAPGQMRCGAAMHDLALAPIALQGLGRRPGGGGVGVGAEVADAAVQVDLAVGRDAHQAVETGSAGGVVALADANAGDLAAPAAPAALDLFRPVPALSAQLQGLGHVGAGHRALVGVELGIRVRRVDAADGHPVEPQFLGGLVHQRLENGGDLVLPGPALGAPGRGVGEHRH